MQSRWQSSNVTQSIENAYCNSRLMGSCDHLIWERESLHLYSRICGRRSEIRDINQQLPVWSPENGMMEWSLSWSTQNSNWNLMNKTQKTRLKNVRLRSIRGFYHAAEIWVVQYAQVIQLDAIFWYSDYQSGNMSRGDRLKGVYNEEWKEITDRHWARYPVWTEKIFFIWNRK